MKKAKEIEELDHSCFLPDGSVISRYARTILYTIMGLSVGLFFLYRFVSSTYVNAERDYLNAETHYLRFLSGENSKEEDFQSLRDILNRRVELHSKYDGLIVQALLKHGNFLMAGEFANLISQRLDEELRSFYGNYSENTLFLYEGRFREALTRAKELRDKIHQDSQVFGDNSVFKKPYGDLLDAYNCLRIAMLEQEIGSRETELVAWQAFLKCAAWKIEDDPVLLREKSSFAYQQLLLNFREGGVSLLDYIKYRLSTLNSQ